MRAEEISKRMEILLGLRGFSVVKMTDKTALWRMVSDDLLLIDVSFPPNIWDAKHGGKVYSPDSPELPVQTRNMISALAEDYEAACKIMLTSEPKSYPVESFEEPEYTASNTQSTIKLSDAEIIEKIDVILNKIMPEEITYGTVKA